MIELIRHVLAIISMVPGLVSPHLGWTADPPPCVSSTSCVATYHSHTNHAFFGAGASEWIVAHEICRSHQGFEVEWEGYDAYDINVEWYETEEARGYGAYAAQSSFAWPRAWLLADDLIGDYDIACGSLFQAKQLTVVVFIPGMTTTPDSTFGLQQDGDV